VVFVGLDMVAEKEDLLVIEAEGLLPGLRPEIVPW